MRTKLFKLLFALLLIASFLVPATQQTEVAEAAWLDPSDGNQTDRIEVIITEIGGGAKSDYVIELQPFYNCAPVEEDSITQFLYEPSIRCVGTYDRVYVATANYAGTVTVKYLDEDTGTQSSATTLWNFATSADHNGCAIIVLQHQTGSLADENGTILVVATKFEVGTYSRRSDSAEDISSFGDSVTVNTSAGDAYPQLIETDDGTILCFYRPQMGADNERYVAYRTLKLAADPDSDSWSAEQEFCSFSADDVTYYKPTKDDLDGDTIHFVLGGRDQAAVDPLKYTDVSYIKKTESVTGTATATSTNELIDSGATFITDGIAGDWRVLNTTDNTHAGVTAVNGEGNLTISNDIFASGESYVLYKFTTAAGTLKHLPLDFSNADHTPDSIYTTPAGNNTPIWDIEVLSGVPYITFMESANYATGTLTNIYQATYSAGWSYADTGIDSFHIEETLGYWPAGAEMPDRTPDIIFASVKDGSNNGQIQAYENVGGTWYIADGNNGTTAICEDGKITESSPGHNFRPCSVVDANKSGWDAAQYFTMLWFYSEGFIDTAIAEGAMRFAYPGYSNGKYLNLGKAARTDFGDLLMTQDDGTTLQPAASNGDPWIDTSATVDSWRAIAWWKVGDIPAAGGNVTVYVYHGDDNATNSNSQSIMDAQFLACDHFVGNAGDAVDANKWTTKAGAVDLGGGVVGTLRLTGTSGTRGQIQQNVSNYPDFPLGAEIRARHYSNIVQPNYQQMGLCEDSDLNDRGAVISGINTDNRILLMTVDNSASTSTNIDGMAVTSYHTWVATWKSGQTKFYRDQDDRADRALSLKATHTTNIPAEDQVLYAYEGVNPSALTYVDWMFARPWTDPEPTVSALSQQSQLLITTLSATLVCPTSATLNGNVTGTASTQYWAFWWGDDCATLPTSMAIGDWDNYHAEAGVYEQGETFSYAISSLTAETCYWFVAGGNTTSGDFDCEECVWFCTASSDYNHGIVVPNQSYATGLTQFLFRNCSEGNITVTIGSSVWTGGTGWTPSDDGNPGVNIIGIKAGVSGGSYNVVVRYTAPFNTLVANMGNGTYQEWGYTLWTPTSAATDGVAKYGNLTLYMEAL